MNITNCIPERTGFTVDTNSALGADFQKLNDWFQSIRSIIEEKELTLFSGVALHFLKEKKLGGEFFDDLTYVKTLESKKDLWVENPPEGVLLTFACGSVTKEQIETSDPWPDIFRNTYPPLWIMEFCILEKDKKSIAKSFLGCSSSVGLPGTLILEEVDFIFQGSWQESFEFISKTFDLMKSKI